MAAGVFVDEIPGLEVVGPIDDHVHAAEQVGDVGSREVGHDRFDRRGGVDGGQMPRGRDRLRQSGGHVGLVEQHLPRQVRSLGHVAIDEPQQADTGPHERHRDDAPERTAANHGAERREPRLS